MSPSDHSAAETGKLTNQQKGGGALLLSPPIPSQRGSKGKPPHTKYRLLRTMAYDILKARDIEKMSDNAAAKKFKLRVAKGYREAYDLLKANGAAIVNDGDLNGDWSGVERVIYAKFPLYLKDPKFRSMLVEFNDRRLKIPGALDDVGEIKAHPASRPVPVAPAPSSVVIEKPRHEQPASAFTKARDVI